MNRDLLTRPFEPHQVKQRPGQHGKVLSYVDVAAVIGRLNEACDAWSFEIVSHEVQDGEAIVLGKLIFIPQMTRSSEGLLQRIRQDLADGTTFVALPAEIDKAQVAVLAAQTLTPDPA